MTPHRLALRLSFMALAGCECSMPPAVVDSGQSACTGSARRCGPACVEPATDDGHCGACGTVCGSTESCAAARCLPDDCPEADCSALQVCDRDRCEGRDCVDVTCAANQTCYQGQCQSEACGGVLCPAGSICQAGVCTDVRCLGVVCPAGRACHQGYCRLTCVEGSDCQTNPGQPCRRGAVSCAGASPACVDGSPVDAGTACGADRVCDPGGACVSCAVAAPCATNPNACTLGATSCVTGAPRCLNDAPRVPGSACTSSDGGAGVCDPGQQCVACVAGAACSGNPGAPCRSGQLQCSTGQPVCVDGAPTPATCDLGRKVCVAGACVTPRSCLEARGAPSGVYTIDPDADGGGPAFAVYCDQDTLDGGWTALPLRFADPTYWALTAVDPAGCLTFGPHTNQGEYRQHLSAATSGYADGVLTFVPRFGVREARLVGFRHSSGATNSMDFQVGGRPVADTTAEGWYFTDGNPANPVGFVFNGTSCPTPYVFNSGTLSYCARDSNLSASLYSIDVSSTFSAQVPVVQMVVRQGCDSIVGGPTGERLFVDLPPDLDGGIWSRGILVR